MKSDVRSNQVWSIEITMLDTPNEAFLMIAIDACTRLPVVIGAATSGSVDDFVAKLDRAGQEIGYPEEVWIDPGFALSTPALKEWGVQRGIEIVYVPAARRTITKLTP
jgi:hypothetical protein